MKLIVWITLFQLSWATQNHSKRAYELTTKCIFCSSVSISTNHCIKSSLCTILIRFRTKQNSNNKRRFCGLVKKFRRLRFKMSPFTCLLIQLSKRIGKDRWPVRLNWNEGSLLRFHIRCSAFRNYRLRL